MTKDELKAVIMRALDNDDDLVQSALLEAADLQGAQEFVLTPLPEDDYGPTGRDTHTEHCCQYHKRCKYAWHDDPGQPFKCSVVRGTKPASYPCNCEHM